MGDSVPSSTEPGAICFKPAPTSNSTSCQAESSLGSSMSRKSDGEKIDDLEKIVSTLVERVDNVRDAMIDKERFAVIEERLNELKKTVEEAGRRRWAIVPSIVAAVIGSILTLLGQLALTSLKK